MNDNQVVIDNQSIFTAERILKKRERKGYPEDQSTWESEENILDKRLIEHFEHGQRRNHRKSGKRYVGFVKSFSPSIFVSLFVVFVLCSCSLSQSVRCKFNSLKTVFNYYTLLTIKYIRNVT